MKESDISRKIQIDLSPLGVRLFRYPVGLYFTKNGYPIKIGTPGISDNIGFVPITITKEMVGTTILQFLAVETKTPTGKPSVLQTTFIEYINTNGGVAFIAKSSEEAFKIIYTHKNKSHFN